jgi:CHU_C Type IX secretion signal domain
MRIDLFQKKKAIFKIALLLIFVSIESHSQSKIWYFGTNAGIQFHGPGLSPTSISGGQSVSYDGSAIATDENDSLLFYSNGEKIWNRNHQLMDAGLLGSGYGSQNSAFIPLPESNHLFYLFTNSDYSVENGCRYSIVDRNLNNGLGGIVPGTKNTLIQLNSTEGMGICKNADGTGYWIVMRSATDQKYFAYQLLPTGLNLSPTISNGLLAGLSGQEAIGYLKIAFNGSKIVHTGLGGTEVGNFNNATGATSGFSVITSAFYYGAEFSQNDHLIYFSAEFYSKIICYSISTNSFTTIQTATVGGPRYVGLEMGPDGKIYIGGPDGGTYLSAIANPDAGGSFEEVAVNLVSGTSCRVGLPNTAHIKPLTNCNSFLPGLLQYRSDTICIGTQLPLPLNPEPFLSYSWFPESGLNSSIIANPVFSPVDTGRFQIHVRISGNGNCEVKDSIFVIVKAVPGPLVVTKDTACLGSALAIGSQSQPDMNYWWTPELLLAQNNAANPRFTPTRTGRFTFYRNAGNGVCSIRDSIEIVVNPLLDLLKQNYSLCQGQKVRFLMKGYPATTYLWTPTFGLDDATKLSPEFLGQEIGSKQFTVLARNEAGCSVVDSVNVQVSQLPTIVLSPDIEICSGIPFRLFASPSDSCHYIWSKSQKGLSVQSEEVGIGNELELVSINNSGSTQNFTFTLFVTTNGLACTFRDSIRVTLFPSNTLDENQKPRCVDLFIPNLVLKEGSLDNQYFEVIGLEPFKENELTLYNRWGELVYKAQPYLNNWNGDGLSDGIYFFHLSLGVGDNKFKGWLEIRK